MEILLKKAKEIVVFAERKKTITKVEITEVVDDFRRKIITAKTNEFGSIILWKDEDYVTIGQWTDTDVINKIKSIYKL
jgi:hypothetical protein